MNYTFSDDGLVFNIDATVYNETTLYKCLYWFSGHYLVDLRLDQINWIVTFRSSNGNFSKETADIIAARLSRDLIDFKLRDLINKETATVRELIIAKAFAHEDVETVVAGAVSDPVGFQPSSITPKLNNDNLIETQ